MITTKDIQNIFEFLETNYLELRKKTDEEKRKLVKLWYFVFKDKDLYIFKESILSILKKKVFTPTVADVESEYNKIRSIIFEKEQQEKRRIEREREEAEMKQNERDQREALKYFEKLDIKEQENIEAEAKKKVKRFADVPSVMHYTILAIVAERMQRLN